MCLVVMALRATPRFPLVIAANRDELHARATAPAAWWPDLPHVFAGRDLVAGGTWLGASRRGRIAAVTNVRDGTPRSGPRSRGELVAQFLAGDAPPEAFGARIGEHAADYAAFNLLLVDQGQIHYSSNRAAPAVLGPGVHAFSNAVLGARWPKVGSAEAAVAAALEHANPIESVLAVLADRGPAVGAAAYESAHFVEGGLYGTRCSTVILVDDEGTVTFVERSFAADGAPRGEIRETFDLESA